MRVFTHTQTHTQKDGSDSMTSTADAGGNKCIVSAVTPETEVPRMAGSLAELSLTEDMIGSLSPGLSPQGGSHVRKCKAIYY